MAADGLTKDKGDPMDLLRSLLKSGVYQIADEEGVLKRKAEEKQFRKSLGQKHAKQNEDKNTNRQNMNTDNNDIIMPDDERCKHGNTTVHDDG